MFDIDEILCTRSWNDYKNREAFDYTWDYAFSKCIARANVTR